MKSVGDLYVFEGPDGVGKTTLSSAFARHLKTTDIEFDYFSFPGKVDGTLGKLVYDLHHNKEVFGIEEINEASLQILHIAAHVDLIESKILPSLKKGRSVILDRYWWSTWVYGLVGNANKRSLQAMIDIEKQHWDNIKPSIVFFITRKEPIGEDANSNWSKLVAEYTLLASNETSDYPVKNIINESTVADAVLAILNQINIKSAD